MLRVSRDLVFFVVSALTLSVCSFSAFAQTTLPRVTVTGIATDGGALTCYDMTCGGLLMGMVQDYLPPDVDVLGPEDVPVDRTLFCRNLAMARPPGPSGSTCSYDAPPSAPLYDPNWVGNGCGDGSFVAAIADQLIGKATPGYNGNLDHPLPGISFFPACQRHDRCYGLDMARDKCDGDFGKALEGTCSSASAYQSTCNTLASAYKAAVSAAGQVPFNKAQAEKACASWAYNMKQNGCPKP